MANQTYDFQCQGCGKILRDIYMSPSFDPKPRVHSIGYPCEICQCPNWLTLLPMQEEDPETDNHDWHPETLELLK